jgi:hypothetical protein
MRGGSRERFYAWFLLAPRASLSLAVWLDGHAALGTCRAEGAARASGPDLQQLDNVWCAVHAGSIIALAGSRTAMKWPKPRAGFALHPGPLLPM